MRRLAYLVMAIAAPQPLLAEPGDGGVRDRIAASLPCVQSFTPMSWRVAPQRLRPERVAPPPPRRRDPPRPLPCFRLVTA